jgi:hypothetical protein
VETYPVYQEITGKCSSGFTKIKTMKDQVIVSGSFKIVSLVLVFIGVITFVLGLYSNHQLTWVSYLIVNYYFFSLAMGGAFFYLIQVVSQSGWSSAFKRVPEAMMSYIPFAAVFFFLLYFGIHDLYPWSSKEVVMSDPLIQHKWSFLNVPFFYARLVICFIIWILFIIILRNISIREDRADPSDVNGIMKLFSKSELYSRILIFILAITFSLTAFDWIMSIDVRWYSTIFALKNLVAAFLHGVSVMTLIIFILFRLEYFPFLNAYHLHDFSRYIFMLSIIWGYFWFAQFMIIWYGNIPAETVYFYFRWKDGWKVLFFLEIGLNWAIPFLLLLPVKTSRNMTIISIVIVSLIIGQYIDLFGQIIPGTTGLLRFGWIEAGMFLGYAGLFSMVVATTLGKAGLIPANHPYLQESLDHRF